MEKKNLTNTINNIFLQVKSEEDSKKEESINASLRDYDLKETEPIYILKSIDFNMASRVARLEFVWRQYYKTIARYVTQNYIRYPIYSDWKTKEKIIKKTIKLTNQVLENLDKNEDDLIASFAEEIIVKIEISDLYPSWLLKKYLRIEYENNLKELRSKLEYENDILKNLICEKRQKISDLQLIVDKKRKKLETVKKKRNRLKSKIEKIEKLKPNFFCSLITLGIYSYMKSSTRKNKILKKIGKAEGKLTQANEELNEWEKGVQTNKDFVVKYNEEISKNNEEFFAKEKKRKISLDNDLSKIIPLSSDIGEEEGFIRLSMLNGFDYDGFNTIKGVYIIHNRENDKYYVGQSKDVMKRLKQHFKDTVPKNSIFAEDYYTSKFKNKGDLFEVKIIPCDTKDELDDLERKMIYEYDSMKSGYNGTNGNI